MADYRSITSVLLVGHIYKRILQTTNKKVERTFKLSVQRLMSVCVKFTEQKHSFLNNP
jgi:hypothetical protein